MNRGVFLDRDGVINEDLGYVHRVQDFHFLNGAIEAIQLFKKLDFKIVIVTNQAGIADGRYTHKDVEILHDYMSNFLAECGASIDAIYYCPHRPSPDDGGCCYCRKPQPGLIFEASRKLDIDLSSSVIVGDKISDVEAGLNAGLYMSFLVDESAGNDVKEITAGVYTVRNLLGVAKFFRAE
jgi:D-glycero-D-manno-heptose 1,7-bisphosphate phosphatase